MPEPVRLTVWGLSELLSAIETVAESFSGAVGLKITEIVQEAAEGRVAPQVLVWEKSVGSVPTIEIPVMVNVADLVLVTVTVFAALELPVTTVPKLSTFGTSCTDPVVSVMSEVADLEVSVTEVATRDNSGIGGNEAGGV